MEPRRHDRLRCLRWLTPVLFSVALVPPLAAFDRNPWAEPAGRGDASPAPERRHQGGEFVSPDYDPTDPPRQQSFRGWDPAGPRSSDPEFIDPSIRFAPGTGLPADPSSGMAPGVFPGYGSYPYSGLLGLTAPAPYAYPGLLLYPGTGWLTPGFSLPPGLPGSTSPFATP